MLKELNSESVLVPDAEKLLLAKFDVPAGVTEDFFELLGIIDSQRENEASDDSSLDLDSLAAPYQEDRLSCKGSQNTWLPGGKSLLIT